MNKRTILLILLIAVTLAACNTTISDSVMQTAVSQVILTSSSEESTTDEITTSDTEATDILDEQLNELNTQLDNANLRLTDQAAEIDALNAELEGVYILLTPTITPTPQDTATPTITPSPTPLPPPTEEALPWYHKTVVANKDTPLYYYEDENDAGYPIMIKTSPVIKFSKGDEFIVDVNRIRADGGANYFLVIGPKHNGYYVNINDVKNAD
jgi:hypothetical protein